MRLLIVLCLFLCACESLKTTPPVLKTYNVGLFYGMSSGPDTLPYVRGLHPRLIEVGWTQAMSELITPESERFKPDSVMVHLPFGRPVPEADFDFAGFTSSQKDKRLQKVVDIKDFVNAWMEYVKRTGVRQLYFYYGYIGADHPVWDNLNRAGKEALVAQNILPIVQLNNALKTADNPKPCGIIIDTAGAKGGFDDNWSIGMAMIEKSGLRYGGEPWPFLMVPKLKDPNYISTTLEHSFTMFDPEKNPGMVGITAFRKDIAGPIIPIVWRLANETDDQYIDRGRRMVKEYQNVAFLLESGMTVTSKDFRP
jgi:hypothetical protein